MKAQSIQHIVESTTRRLPQQKIEDLKAMVRERKPPDLVPPERMTLREVRLEEADVRPSPVARERLLGTNDLVDVNYLIRAFNAARSICRVVLRNRTGREIGYGTGFKVAPRILITNHHVLEDLSAAETALVEFDYELDESGSPRATTRFALDPRSFYLSNPELDFALTAISPDPMFGPGRLKDYGFLRMIREEGKINPGEFVTIIQHPSGQPKQIALRENELLAIEELVLWYQSDTAQGSSGAPVFNDSWQIVALHHSGVPRKDEEGNWLLKNGQPAGPDAEDGDIDWIANEGIRASRIVRFVETHAELNPHSDEFLRTASGELQPALIPTDHGARPSPSFRESPQIGLEPVPGGARLTVPLSFTISVDGMPSTLRSMPISTPRPVVAAAAVERMKIPIVDPNYQDRQGYDPSFLDIEVPLPDVPSQHLVAKMENGEHVLPYEHFSVVMDKERRLALFTASNVDARPEKKRPEPGKDYSRRGLGGFGPNDREMWLTDPRVTEFNQLPDRFYTKDGGAFDKGHLVRRDDVCWGDSYQQVRRANGDTYHTTNCSPQIADFNRASRGGIWGRLENVILRQAKTERYCVFSGPLLQDNDREFVGKDHRGEVRIQIPTAYWKVVIAQAGDELQSFAFLLEQDLTGVPLEFAVDAEWIDSMTSIEELEASLGNVRFPDVVKRADQYETEAGEALFAAEELMGLRRGRQR